MKALIVYDSAFGNTEQIAFALRDFIQQHGEVMAIRPVNFQLENLADIDLFIVGSPTQKFSPLPDTSALLKMLPKGSLRGISVAAFDTRIDLKKVNNRFLNLMVRIYGYAAEPIAKKLKAKGGNLVSPAEGFFVSDTKGPLAGGELERAKIWAASLVNTANNHPVR